MQKIMFNDRYGLTQAVLEGRKTMTRRIIRIDNDELRGMQFRGINEDGLVNMRSSVGVAQLVPKYHIGEVVAVAQSYNDIYEELKHTCGSSSSVTRHFFHKYIQGGRMPVCNKMFVKSEAMLHQIRIIDVGVERLQDISDEDCIKEGLSICSEYYECDRGGYIYDTALYMPEVCPCYGTPQDAFAALIDKVSGKGTWNRNPWVFAYSFEVIK